MRKSRLICTVCIVIFATISTTTSALPLPLEPRLGGLAFYDPNLDITWAANANMNGADTWMNQVHWVADLTIGGVGGWRLPSMDVNFDDKIVDCRYGGVEGCIDNEMGYLFWEEGISASTPGPFHNIQISSDAQISLYWSETWHGNHSSYATNFDNGNQGNIDATTLSFAWPVQDGDNLGSGLSIYIPGGTLQECTAHGGSNVSMNANFVGDAGEIVGISWYVDGSATSVASGTSVEFFVPLGTHTIDVIVTTMTLGDFSESINLSIQDTEAPVITTAFVDEKTGETITSVAGKASVGASINVIDICDPEPISTSVFGVPYLYSDSIKIKSDKKDFSISLTSEPNTDAAALSVIATDETGNVSGVTAMLPVAP